MAAEMPEKTFVSFGFKKKKDNLSISESKFTDNSHKSTNVAKDYVLSLEEKKINSTLQGDEDKEIVIPLTLKNKWNVPSKAKQNTDIDDSNRSLEAEAAREIIKDTYGTRDAADDSRLYIPMVIQNKVPEGYETEDRLDVSLRAEESTLEDYEKIPVEQYGLAMLRGMGWKKGDPIGRSNKGVTVPIEAVMRPKGLGLGANWKLPDSDDDDGVVCGSLIHVEAGSYKGLYGKVEGLDENTGRVVVRLADDRVVTIARLVVVAISKKEYERNAHGKPIKSDRMRDERKRHETSHTHKSRDGDERSSKKSKHSSETNGSRNRGDVWLRPHIRVRFVNKKYKYGDYYNKKVVIVDVADLDADTCICRTDDGKLLEDIPSSWLETVVPRHEPHAIVVVRGKRAGQVGRILERNKSHSTVTVQLTHDHDDTFLKLSYDDICEYVGDTSDRDWL